MRALVRWLLARRVGKVEADRFLEELDELHRLKVEAEGEVAGDRWRRKELRRALLGGLAGLVRRAQRQASRRVGAAASAGGVGASFQDLARDVRFGVRTLRKRPLFTFLVVGTLGLGIGATTTVFSLVDGILLKDMGYERPGELVTVWETFPGWRDDPVLKEAWDKLGLTWSEFLTLRDNTRAFSALGVYINQTLTLSGAGDPVRLEVGQASANLFSVLGIRPLLGRTFLRGEEGPGAPHVAVLGYDLWKTRFGADPHILGRSVTLEGQPFEVVGVLPGGVRVHSTLFNLFNSAIDTGVRALWVPAYWYRTSPGTDHSPEAVGRLRPGVSRAEALAEVDAILRKDRSPDQVQFRLATPRDEVVRGHRSALLLLLAASGLLLLIACGNAATLLLGEALDRTGEISTRVAVGASRARIARQLLTESLILGLAGSLMGLALTPLGIRAFLALGPALPRLEAVEVNQIVLLVAILAGVMSAVVFGFAPVLLHHRTSLHAALQRHGRSGLGGGGRVQVSLISGELALTVVLLVTAGLLTQSLRELAQVDPGFQARGVATIRAQIPESNIWSNSQSPRDGVREFRREALRRVRAIPGVLQAGTIDRLPFPGRPNGTTFGVDGRDSEGSRVMARLRRASPGYFNVMGIPLLAGRNFTAADGGSGAEAVAVINETMARQLWPGGSPLEARIRSDDDVYRIIGVVGDVRERHLWEEPLPMVYRPASSSSGDFSIVARTAGAPEDLVPLMREAVRSANPGVPLTQETTMEALVTGSEGAERFRTFLVAGFGFLATLLALVGVFGVTARSVAHRNRELGIRKALGAHSAGLVRTVALGTLKAGGLGVGLGLLGALATTRLLKAFLYDTRAWDTWTYGGAALVLGTLCVGAAVLAAARVARVEPMRVLREE